MHNVRSHATEFHCSVFGNQFMNVGEVTVAKETIRHDS
jgi:hypothetical protein